MSGTVYGIGAGPGDPGLLTMRAFEVLRQTSLCVAPQASEDGDSVALSIVSAYLPSACEIVRAVFPMSEDSGCNTAAATAAANTLADAARAGRNAAFVTLGDTTLYSTWGQVLNALRRDHPHIAVETVPGVTAFSACMALLGEPLAEGRDPVLIWPGALPEDLTSLLKVAPNIIALKAGRHLGVILEAAAAAGATVSIVQRCGMERERVIADARELPAGPVEYFTTAVVRKKDVSDE